MATAMKKCRVCGKLYEACHTIRRITDGFRWQDVSCSPACGSIYLADIRASRGIKDVEETKVEDAKELKNNFDTEDDDMDEEELEIELDNYFDGAE